MNYLAIYDSLLERGKNRVKNKGDGLHRHRIVPGYQGGQYIPENISYLTRQEHRIVHRFRWKLYEHPGDMWAYISLGGKNAVAWNTGLHHSSETIEKIKGPKTEEGKANMSISAIKRAEKEKEIGIDRFGKNNQAFKGFYITPWGKFETGNLKKLLGDDYPNDVSLWCKNSKKIITERSFRNVSEAIRPHKKEWVNKTREEVGFGFEKDVTHYG